MRLDAKPQGCYSLHEATPYTPHRVNYLSQLMSGTFDFGERDETSDTVADPVPGRAMDDDHQLDQD